MTPPAPFFLGCAVWSHQDWIGSLFPARSKSAEFLRLYSRRLSTVEGNTTFYAVPKLEVVQRWAAETPEGFQFCLKLPQTVSHAGPLSNKQPETQAFLERMAALGNRLGPFFLQLPPAFSPMQISDLEGWLAAWPPEYRIAVEVRHPAWFLPQNEMALQDLLDRHRAGRVLMDVRPLDLGDMPGAEADLQRARDHKPDVPLHALASSDIALIRYISHPDIPRNAALLEFWAGQVADWLRSGISVYFFMHCPVERHSPALCREFQQRLAARIDIPPLPWDTLGEADVQQQRLF